MAPRAPEVPSPARGSRPELGASTDATVRFIGDALAFAVPLAFYAATASGFGHFLDSGEFVAVATDLGISHPPGHPLMGLLSHAASFIPLGTIAFRVALLSAVCAAFALLFFHRALVGTVEALGLRAPLLSVPLGVAGTWLLAGAAGFWLQAVRPEVYALEALLLFRVLERLTHIERSRPGAAPLALYDASLCFGLALANHHFLAFLLLPAAAPTLGRVVASRGTKPLGYATVAALVGLWTYVYLPLRAVARPFLNLGEPKNLERLYWVVSAQAFQGNTTLSPQPIADRFGDVVIQMALGLGIATPFVALGGAYLLLRSPTSRRLGVLWTVTAAVSIAARAWLGFIRSNPDALGYLMPAMAALTVLAVSMVAVLLGLVAGPRPTRPHALAVALVMSFPIASGYLFVQGAETASLEAFVDTDALSDPMRRDLPTGAVVLAHDPQTIFLYYGGEAQEHLRPDVTFVPMPLLTYPGMIESLSEAHPELVELLRAYLLEGELRQPDLQSLAAQRPLLVEMDLRVPPTLYETLVPSGVFHAVLPDGATDVDEREGRGARAAALRALRAQLPASVEALDDQTRAHLLWIHYTGALYYAGFGDREGAAAEVHEGLLLNPLAAELGRMKRALDATPDERGPMDVRPFMIDPSR
jgi:hypothetical protein